MNIKVAASDMTELLYYKWHTPRYMILLHVIRFVLYNFHVVLNIEFSDSFGPKHV